MGQWKATLIGIAAMIVTLIGYLAFGLDAHNLAG
jgi:hypothetical protein